MQILHCVALTLLYTGYVLAQSESTDHSTTDVPSTTVTPLTSTVPTPVDPIEGNWTVTDGNVTCIKADLKIRFIIPHDNESTYLNLSPNADSSKSSCFVTNDTQVLFLESEVLDLRFMFEKDSANTFVRNITLFLPSPIESRETYYNDTKTFSVQNGYSFMCKSKSTIDLGNVTMEIFNIRIQAFGVTDNKFGDAEFCAADEVINDIIPIVVACALAALIILVLIAYLVGRRRSRSKGYNSV